MISRIYTGSILGGPYAGLPSFFVFLADLHPDANNDKRALDTLLSDRSVVSKTVVVSADDEAEVDSTLQVLKDHGFRICLITGGQILSPHRRWANWLITELREPTWLRFATNEIRLLNMSVRPSEVELAPNADCVYSLTGQIERAATDTRVAWRALGTDDFDFRVKIWEGIVG